MKPSGARGAARHRAIAILAAGASTRLGEPKQLVVFEGETLLERAVRVALATNSATVFVVLGSESERILQSVQFAGDRVRVLLNTAWQRGMSTSLALAASAAERALVDDLVVMTCDQPAVTCDHLCELAEAARADHVAASFYDGRLGVPAVFPSFAFAALQQLQGDMGARDLLSRGSVISVPFPAGTLDVDTPADLARLQARDGNSDLR